MTKRTDSLTIAFFGSSLLSAYWNGAATYYRGILEALHRRGHRITFYEPDAFDRQQHRDIEPPDYATTVVYAADNTGLRDSLRRAAAADVIVKASGVGVFDEELERMVLELRKPHTRVVFWDVDAPATLSRVEQNPRDPFRVLIGQYDGVFTYGGGPPVVNAYTAFGARRCVPVYNALDPASHYPVPPREEWRVDLALLANRMPDREARIAEYFFKPASVMSDRRFLLGGSGWHENVASSPNVHAMGHVYTRDHNAFNSSPLAVLNVNRQSMAECGYSPPTRIFEAAGAGACIITDAWEGIEQFLEPREECLVAASGEQVAEHLRELTPDRAKQLGKNALRRARECHTYEQRAALVERELQTLFEAG
ncbi:MAG: glycosyltransferase [Chitinivibrionales bacterium]|nr:glycosyltransferase [Chitinivibrionales bacterium]